MDLEPGLYPRPPCLEVSNEPEITLSRWWCDVEVSWQFFQLVQISRTSGLRLMVCICRWSLIPLGVVQRWCGGST